LCRLVQNSGVGAIASRVKKKMMAFGEYPLVMLKDARELHFEARKILAAGVDPMAERKAETETKHREAEARQREAEAVLRK
jgi:Arm DNA-binding domain